MTKLHLKFNDTLEDVRLKLVGGGTIIIEAFKHEHVDVLCNELVKYIKHEKPSELVFDTVINERLVEELEKVNIKYDETSKKLNYFD